MNRVANLRMGSVLVLAALALSAGYAASASAQKAVEKERRPRLPNYFAKVVTDDQRTEINTIQEEHAPQIMKLRAELDAAIEKRDAAIEKVLTAEQRKEVAKLRAEAAARRKDDASAASGTTTETRTTTETGPATESDSPKSKSKAKKAA